MKKTILSALCFFLLANNATALKNPAAAYCEAMGYLWGIEPTPDGDVSSCIFPDGGSCDGQDFLKGKCSEGEEHSYCTKNGYAQKIGYGEECSSPYPDFDCLVCVMADGKTVEVTKLMNLSFQEGVCGDGRCVLGETHENCPKDCPQGGLDYLCEPQKDGICDVDCIISGEDPDCPVTTTTTSSTTTTTYVKKTKCGDGVCETGKGENYRTCAEDCPPGIADGYCAKLKDGFCDPDCIPADDPDCVPASTTTTLGLCGNGVCDAGENRANCPTDCPSGGKDGYCEPIADGVCDADCPGNLDPDCAKKPMGYLDYLGYVSVFIFIVLVIVLVYGKIKNR